MYTTHNILLQGCLLSSIAHAIMTNVYPELAYEVSWDRNNFSMQDSFGVRGTITFRENTCVGAIRNESSSVIFGDQAILDRIKSFPKKLIEIAQSDTLQYLLEDNQGVIAPAVTSMFWCDSQGLHWMSKDSAEFERDFSLFYTCALPQNKAIEALTQYYEMDTPSLTLLQDLYAQKRASFAKEIYLTDAQRDKIPGDILTTECQESFAEINIFIN